MDSQTFSKFAANMRANISSEALGIGALSAVSGVGAVYDTYKARGLSSDMKELQAALKGESGHEMVNLRAYLKKRDPAVTVVDTPKKVDAFLEREGIRGFKKLMNRAALRSMVEQGSNAAAYRGQHGEYIFGRGKLPKAVADHEHGHILDFRAKGIKLDGSPRMGEYVKGYIDSFIQSKSKDRFMKGRYKAETEAWRHAAVKGKKNKDLEDKALGSYEKGFHVQRGISRGATGLIALQSLANTTRLRR